MTSRREQILTALAAALTNAAVTAAPIARSRTIAIANGEFPAIVVKPATDPAEPLATRLTRHELEAEVEVHTRGDIPDQLADPIICAAHAAIMADPTLGGLSARIIERDTTWEFADADQSAGIAIVKYHILYVTQSADLTRAA